MSDDADTAPGLPPVPLDPLRALDPRQLGQYRLLGRLGSGGMGVAFLTEGDGRWAVVKMIRSDLSEDRAYRARIARELEAMRRAVGPYTAQLLESELDGDPAWFAMEFIPGVTLTRRVTDMGPLSEVELTGFAAGLADVLSAIHVVGVVHRDLKPSNVMLSPTGPRLIDFGIADIAEGTQLTRTGSVLGSTGWLAPEQLTGDPVSPATDVHAWGLCVLFAATGMQPFGGDTASTAMYRVLEYTPEVPDSVPEPLRALVETSLNKDPTRRPTVNRLQATLAPPKPPPLPPPPPVPVAPTVSVLARDQWTEAVPRPASASEPSPPPPRRSAGSPPTNRPGESGSHRAMAAVSAVVAIVAAVGIVAVVALQGRTNEATSATPVSSSTGSRVTDSTAAVPTDRPTESAPASPTPVPEPTHSPTTPAPTYSVRVNYANRGIPDQTVKNSLAWQVDVCSTDAQLLKASTRNQIRLYAREGGRWSPQKSTFTTNEGDRCGKNGVHVVLNAVEDAPSASAIGAGWSDCRSYRVTVPETSSFAKTILDMCVQTRADQPA